LYKPFVVVSPSGLEKARKLMESKTSIKVRIQLSFTTRKPRADEVHGQHYFFICRDEFEVMIGN
jgi:guanylate kinase